MSTRLLLSAWAIPVLCAGIPTSASPAFAQETETKALLDAVDRRLDESSAEMIEIRRDLHRHPELSGRERRTAGVVAGRLQALGLEVRTGVGGHGVVAMLRGALPGPLVAFRADMDAVAFAAPDPVEFASAVDGVRHVCGHDIHTTVGLALAEGLATVRSELPGSVMFIFQPAEENATGARAMLADGIFADGVPDAIFAYHTAPLEVGQVGTRSGTLLPQRDRFRVTLRGVDDLSKHADQAVSLIRAQSSAARGATSVAGDFAIARVWESDPGDRPGSWVIRGSVTTTGPQVSEQVRKSLQTGLEELRSADLDFRLEYDERFVAGVTNDPELEAKARTPLRSVLGEDGLVTIQTVPTQFSEDFGSFQERVPGVMYFLGVSNSEEGWVGMPHSPDFIADERSIGVGASAMAAVILDYLGSGEDRLADVENDQSPR
ncbi:MAG: M20 family metallopeptidase [marine benthic group bacterium]|nr:M20 family metallopeptidase [Gemmatimonadota bacterium]